MPARSPPLNYSPASQGNASAVRNLYSRITSTIADVTSQIGNYFAEGFFTVSVETTPVDAEARISLGVKAQVSDSVPTEASIFLDALSDGTSRIILRAGQTRIENASGTLLQAFGTDGSLVPDRIAAGTVSDTAFHRYGDSNISNAENSYSIPSDVDLFTAHAGQKTSITYFGNGFDVPTSQVAVAVLTFNYRPTTSSLHVCRAGIEGFSGGTWIDIQNSIVSQSTQSISARQVLSVALPVDHTMYTQVRPFIAAGSNDVVVQSLSFELRTLYK